MGKHGEFFLRRQAVSYHGVNRYIKRWTKKKILNTTGYHRINDIYLTLFFHIKIINCNRIFLLNIQTAV